MTRTAVPRHFEADRFRPGSIASAHSVLRGDGAPLGDEPRICVATTRRWPEPAQIRAVGGVKTT